MGNYLNVFLIGGGVQIVNPRRRCLRRSVPVDGATSECSIVLEQSVDDEPVHHDAEDGGAVRSGEHQLIAVTGGSADVKCPERERRP